MHKVLGDTIEVLTISGKGNLKILNYNNFWKNY